MASNRGYTTAQKVRDVLAGQVVTYITDAIIDAIINRIEAVIDTKLKIGVGGTTAFTWTTTTVPDWAIEMATTFGAAVIICGPSSASWNTQEQLENMQNICSFWFKVAMDIIDSQDFGTFLLEQHGAVA